MLQFDVMEKDTRVCHVCVTGDDVTVTRYKSGMLYPFSKIDKRVSPAEAEAFLAGRVFPPERDGVNEALAALGLSAYNVLDIIERTKGILPTDYLSVVITERD